MNICIVGMGLIGGSFAKAIKENTDYKIFGHDLNDDVLTKAENDGIIDYKFSDDFDKIDVFVICIYPGDTVKFIEKNKDKFKKGCIVSDFCGIKSLIANKVDKTLFDRGVYYVGCHPMAGKEVSGYENSDKNLYKNASFIISKTIFTNENAITVMEDIAKKINFAKITYTDPESHDKIIALTSQMAHIVSSAYIKSPTAKISNGFCGGSFEDMTRVAFLNEQMWSELFLENKDKLLYEVDLLISNLKNYRDAILNDNRQKLKELLVESKNIKDNFNKEKGQ